MRESLDVETPAQLLHRLTSYSPDREWTEPPDDPQAIRDFEVNDLSRLPYFFKRYPESLPRVDLPRDLPSTTPSAVDVLAGVADVRLRELDVPHLSRLLHLAAGVVRTAQRSYGTYPFRAAGSAGGRFPLELYVAVPEGGSLPPGVHWYHPLEHALVEIGEPPIGTAPAVVVTGIPWRTGWRYRERGFRHVYWDAGTMLSQLLAAAESTGLAPALYTVFPDDAVEHLVGADGVHEWPVAVVSLGEGEPAIDAHVPAVTGDVDAAPIEFPLVTAAQRAGGRDALGSPWDVGPPVSPTATDPRPIEEVVLARGSQRIMDPRRALSLSLLETCMTAAVRGVHVPHFVVVHAVENVAPGVYRWPDLASPVRSGLLRDELYRICMDQDLGRDAAFVVIAAADVTTLDDRAYRDAQLAAGLVEGRLHLLAYALGASASGMTFIDSEVPALLGGQLDALLFTCVGAPAYRSAAGGLPGAPTAVRSVKPRFAGR